VLEAFQDKESWAAQIVKESSLAVGGAATGSAVAIAARSKVHLERKMNLRSLAHQYYTIPRKDYMERLISIMHSEF
jgi:hypothetical protein